MSPVWECWTWVTFLTTVSGTILFLNFKVYLATWQDPLKFAGVYIANFYSKNSALFAKLGSYCKFIDHVLELEKFCLKTVNVPPKQE